MQFRPEPAHVHGTPERTAVLIVNLGTPDAPTAPAVRRYLREFLSDRRVVEIPRLIWWFILNCIILPIRSSKSAAKYASIWSSEGSPLKVFTDRQTRLLRGILGHRGQRVTVEYAMRYGNPSLPAVLDQLKAGGVTRILVLPLYPQYSATTTASSVDAINHWAARIRYQPEMRFINSYHDHPAYIEALAARITRYWEKNNRSLWAGQSHARLVLSFHGVPKRTLMLGDPYHCQCLKTGRLLTEALKLEPEQVVVCFQSRFGKAEWLQPYTAQTLQKLARDGVSEIDIFCPGFPADCLETLEEIAIEGKELFLAAGGKTFRHIPCLNDDPAWIAGMAHIAEQHLQGWPTRPQTQGDDDAAAAQRLRALERGAAA